MSTTVKRDQTPNTEERERERVKNGERHAWQAWHPKARGARGGGLRGGSSSRDGVAIPPAPLELELPHGFSFFWLDGEAPAASSVKSGLPALAFPALGSLSVPLPRREGLEGVPKDDVVADGVADGMADDVARATEAMAALEEALEAARSGERRTASTRRTALRGACRREEGGQIRQ